MWLGATIKVLNSWDCTKRDYLIIFDISKEITA
jgi:hypothetical protein